MLRSLTGRGPMALAIATAAVLLLAPQASGAQRLGEAYGNSGGIGCPAGTYVQTASLGNSYAAPFDGVITSWTSAGFAAQMAFKVVRLGGGDSFTVIGADSLRGAGTYQVRLPVRQGDVIGYFTPATNCPYGGTAGSDRYRRTEGNPGVNSSDSFTSTSSDGYVLPIEASLERDRDNDGYGDETQDACPTNPSTHGECPLPTTLGQTLAPYSGGQSCVTSTRVVTSSPGFQSAAPHAGVITSWSHQSQANVGTGTIRLKTFRPLGGDDYKVIGESVPQAPVPSTLNSYPTRIAVNEGDKIGLAINGTVPCSVFTAAGTYGRISQDVPAGSSATFPGSNGALDVAAVLEADADADGFGDTSQDLCPTDPATQGQCPVIGPPSDGACEKARKKLEKAKAKLKKLKRKDAAARKIKGAKAKVKKAKKAVKKAC